VHAGVHHQFAADLAFGLVDPAVGGPDVVTDRPRAGTTDQRGHRHVEGVPVIDEHALEGRLDAIEAATVVSAGESEDHRLRS
jgi:hypothetical protein